MRKQKHKNNVKLEEKSEIKTKMLKWWDLNLKLIFLYIFLVFSVSLYKKKIAIKRKEAEYHYNDKDLGADGDLVR